MTIGNGTYLITNTTKLLKSRDDFDISHIIRRARFDNNLYSHMMH